MDRSKRTEVCEFWKEAFRLWSESGLSVRDFCARGGLTEHTFYVRRRELLPENTVSDNDHELSAASNAETSTSCRRRRSRKPVIADDAMHAAITSPFVELVAPQLQRAMPGGLWNVGKRRFSLSSADGVGISLLFGGG